MIKKISNTPYLFVEIWVPKREPYNNPQHGWATIVGDIVKPIVSFHPNIKIWFLQEGPWWQLCFSDKNLKEANNTLRKILKKYKFTIKRYIRGSCLEEALAGSRWNPVKKQKTKYEKTRSLLLCDAWHSICSLYLNCLIKRGKYWVIESPQCKKQNPHGNLFESFVHLVANITEVKFDILLQAKTRWMHEGWQNTKITCHL